MREFSETFRGQKFTNSPNEKFLLMILCFQAKLENDNRGINVKRGLKNKCELGVRPGVAPLGYLNERSLDRNKGKIVVDPLRAPTIKQLRDGTVRKYVYYHCSRFDQSCKQPYVQEDELLVQFLDLIDKVDLDKTGMRKKLEAEVERMNQFTADVLGMQNEITIPKMDVRGYAKYVLKNGKVKEKREILELLKSQINLNNGKIGLE